MDILYPNQSLSVSERSGDEILTQAETAKLLCISTKTLGRLNESGTGPKKLKISNRRVGYLRSTVEAYVFSLGSVS